MAFFRRNPFFCTILIILAGLCIVGLFYLSQLTGELALLKASYETKASQYDRYLDARPSPTRSNLEAIDENYRDLYEVYEKALGILDLNTFQESDFFGATPVSRADWSFELHKFKENARYAALSNSIELPAEVEFGFGEFTGASLPPEDGERVFQQIVVVSSLLDTLFESGIDSFVAVQRGVKLGSTRSDARSGRPQNRLYGDGDEFTISPGESIAVPGTIDSYVFRLAFRGQSIALRGFLNRIANSELPYVIRGVEADLSSESGQKTITGDPFASDAEGGRGQASVVPIIENNTSLFLVTVEFLQLAVDVESPNSPESERGAENV